MTAFEFVSKQPAQGINEWIELINCNGLAKHENLLLSIADELGLITVNDTAAGFNDMFIKSINI